jgi:cyclopropane fatty-acyl-phospholipid synthase-like methyltransferase
MNRIEPYKGISNLYDEIRPSYPEELIEDIINKTNLKSTDSLLEIGPGTGKATVQFAEKGFRIHGVELGEDMAEIFKLKCTRYPRVSLDISSFEEWSPSNQCKFDMIFCAQAFHWIDTSIKYEKCHQLLKDDCYLVLFWYNPEENKSDKTKLIDLEVEEVIRKYIASYSGDTEKPERRAHSGISKDDERES